MNNARYFLKNYCFAIAIIVLASVVISGCGGDYLPEKYLYKARQKLSAIDVEHATPEELAPVIKAFRIVTDRWPLSKMASDAHYEIAKLYVAQEQYINARKELETIEVNFSNKSELSADAKFAVGQIYEEEGAIDQAILTYKELYDLYPYTRKGLYAPEEQNR